MNHIPSQQSGAGLWRVTWCLSSNWPVDVCLSQTLSVCKANRYQKIPEFDWNGIEIHTNGICHSCRVMRVRIIIILSFEAKTWNFAGCPSGNVDLLATLTFWQL